MSDQKPNVVLYFTCDKKFCDEHCEDFSCHLLPEEIFKKEEIDWLKGCEGHLTEERRSEKTYRKMKGRLAACNVQMRNAFWFKSELFNIRAFIFHFVE